MYIAILTLVVAIAISGVAAWYSIVGLMAIFASAAIPIAIMGGVLEVSKLVTASWLYQNWRTSPKSLKIYLTFAVITLMIITSMGIFGFLSKAHIDQTLIGGDNSLQIESLDQQVSQQQRKIDDATKVISQLDSSVQALIDNERIRGRDGAIAVRESQSVERDSLTTIISNTSKRVTEIRKQRQGLAKEQLKYEAEVGPIRYIAEFVYAEKANTEMLESAVRWVIILIISVFDPLAILLLIAANISLSKPKTIRTVVNVNKVDEDWNEIKVEAEDPQPLSGQPEFFVLNKDPENTVEWSDEIEPDKEVRKEKKTRRAMKRTPVANTISDYGSISDIRKSKNEQSLRDNGTYGNTHKKD
jgi:hypothetical protein